MIKDTWTGNTTALLVRPGEPAEVVHINTKLETLQAIVNGYIEAYYPHEDMVIICNDEGKLNNEPMSRAIVSDNGEVLDVICGTFLLFNDAPDGELGSLSTEQVEKAMAIYEEPQLILRVEAKDTLWRQVYIVNQNELYDKGVAAAIEHGYTV